MSQKSQNNQKCTLCGGNNVRVVRTLKHYWNYCKSCGSATREDVPDFESTKEFRRSEKTLRTHTPPMATSIGKNKLIESDVSLLYDYMATESHVKKHREQYKVFDRFMNEVIRKYNIEVKGKTILDVSGGNGSFIKEFENIGATVAMSEFNQKSVEFAINEFGLDARRFDFNSEDISTKFNKRFNVVMMRYAIMFCRDFNRFMDQMALITEPETTLIINGSMAPSMGAFLRSQYDDYTYLVLYSKDKVVDIMSKHGYKLIGAHEESGKNKESYSHDMHSSVRRLDWRLYRLPAILKGVPNDGAIHSHVLVFKKQ